MRERYLGKCYGKSVKWLKENLEKEEETVDDRLVSEAEIKRDEWNRLKTFFDEIFKITRKILLLFHMEIY